MVHWRIPSFWNSGVLFVLYLRDPVQRCIKIPAKAAVVMSLYSQQRSEADLCEFWENQSYIVRLFKKKWTNKKKTAKKAFMKLEALQISSQEQPEGLKPAFFHLKEASAQARDKRAVQEARTARLSHPLLWTGRSCTKSIHRTRFLGTPSEGIWKSGRSWQWIPAPVCQFAMGDSSSWTSIILSLKDGVR